MSWTTEESASGPGRPIGFSILHNVQTGCGPHSVSYAMGTRGCFTEVKWPRREVNQPLPPAAEIKNDGAIPPLLYRFQGIVLN
jgi:hypothetical protein